MYFYKIPTQAHSWRTLPKNNCYHAPLPPSPLFPQLRAAQLRTVAVWIPATSYLLRTPARDINHSSLHTLHLHSQHYIPIYWLVVDNT